MSKLTREQVEEVRMWLRRYWPTQPPYTPVADALCDLALSALSRPVEPVAGELADRIKAWARQFHDGLPNGTWEVFGFEELCTRATVLVHQELDIALRRPREQPGRDAVDAARYRWLRDNSMSHVANPPVGTMRAGEGIKVIYDFPTTRVPCTAYLEGVAMDSVIDAALKSQTKEGFGG